MALRYEEPYELRVDGPITSSCFAYMAEIPGEWRGGGFVHIPPAPPMGESACDRMQRELSETQARISAMVKGIL